MKKFSLMLLVAFYIGGTCNLSAQSTIGIKDIREDLFYSDFNLNKCWEFYNSIISIEPKEPLISAYQAVSEALIAKHTWNLASKYSYLKHSQELLNAAITQDKNNLEMRFLRLYIQRSIPSYLRMSKNMEEDKKVIMANLDQLNARELGKDIVAYISNYMSSPDVSTQEEAAAIKKKLAGN